MRNRTFTLIFLGGSTMACIYMEEASRFSYLVGNRSKRRRGKRSFYQ